MISQPKASYNSKSISPTEDLVGSIQLTAPKSPDSRWWSMLMIRTPSVRKRAARPTRSRVGHSRTTADLAGAAEEAVFRRDFRLPDEHRLLAEVPEAGPAGQQRADGVAVGFNVGDNQDAPAPLQKGAEFVKRRRCRARPVIHLAVDRS